LEVFMHHTMHEVKRKLIDEAGLLPHGGARRR
jgi:hypothetical protein